MHCSDVNSYLSGSWMDEWTHADIQQTSKQKRWERN